MAKGRPMAGIEETEEVRFTASDRPVGLEGMVSVPLGAAGVVVFAHGSGSSRFSTRNMLVAAQLRTAGLATFLFDLLTEPEAADRANVFNIPLLAGRVLDAVRFMRLHKPVAGLPVGLFGASTGAAAALVAAAGDPSIGAVVSRGGRPDLAGEALGRVRAPTLLIVGSLDHGVIELNEQAYAALACEKRLEVVQGASHLFEEPGTLEEAARAARDWFALHLGARV